MVDDIRTLPNGIQETLKRCDVCQRGTTWNRSPSGPWTCTRCGTKDQDQLVSSISHAPQPPPAYGGYSAYAPKAPRPIREISWLLLAGACLAVLGALLPWISASSGLASVSHNGIQNGSTDGWAGIVVGVIIVVWELVFLSGQQIPGRKTAVMQGILAIIVGGIGIYDVSDISNRVDTFNSTVGGTASVGIGVYVMVIAGVVLLIGAIWRFTSV